MDGPDAVGLFVFLIAMSVVAVAAIIVLPPWPWNDKK